MSRPHRRGTEGRGKHQLLERLLEQLNSIEAEMMSISYWSDPALPEAEQVGFERWLQFKFLPEARRRIQCDDLPEDSHVGVIAMRQYGYHSVVPEAQTL